MVLYYGEEKDPSAIHPHCIFLFINTSRSLVVPSHGGSVSFWILGGCERGCGGADTG